MQPSGNPNSVRGVFNPTPASKRRKTEEGPSPINPGTSGLPKRSRVDKPIDLTKDDASHSPTVTGDSDDSLNLGAAERSKPRIADDGRATQRLKAERRGGRSSKTADTDTEDEPIDEFPAPTKKPVKEKGVVRGIVQNLESRNGQVPPKLPLNSYNPLKSVPPGKPGPKVRLFFAEEE